MRDECPADAERFLELLRPLERELELYCRRLIWDPNLVPDALQNALRRGMGAFARYRPEASFRAWIFRILTREVFALNRKHARRGRFEFQLDPAELEALAVEETSGTASAPCPGQERLERWLDDELLAALKTLTENERAVLLLQALGGFRYREIAELLEMPMGSVMGFLARARRKMRCSLVASKPNFLPDPP